jgi:hypothetical protein
VDIVDLVDLVDLGDLAGPLRPSPALAGPRRLMSAPHTPFGPQCHPSQASGKVQISTFPTRFACYGGHGFFPVLFQFSFSFFLVFWSFWFSLAWRFSFQASQALAGPGRP